MTDMWESMHFSCNRKKVFGDVDPMKLTLEGLDEYCRKAGIVWEDLGNGEAHIHGCGFDCGCHGGKDNKKLRPRD